VRIAISSQPKFNVREDVKRLHPNDNNRFSLSMYSLRINEDIINAYRIEKCNN